MPAATSKTVKEFFGMTLQEMKAEWIRLSKEDKADILSGLSDGTLSY